MYSAQDTLAGGLPHSEIPGSTIARISPGLFAACHVLHRLSVPRHPPDALHLRLSATPNGKNHTGYGRSLAKRYTPSRAATLSEDTSTERTIEGKVPPIRCFRLGHNSLLHNCPSAKRRSGGPPSRSAFSARQNRLFPPRFRLVIWWSLGGVNRVE